MTRTNGIIRRPWAAVKMSVLPNQSFRDSDRLCRKNRANKTRMANLMGKKRGMKDAI